MTPRPYRSETRRAAADETRERILAAARALLGETASFSMAQVAKRARVTRVTVYHQFESKHRLLDAVFDAIADEGGLHTALPRAFQSPDPRAALRSFVHTFCVFWSQHRDVIARLNATMLDADIAVSLGERRERRRFALRALVRRFAGGQADDLVDLLYAVTSFEVWDLLASPERDIEAVEALVQTAVAAIVDRVLPIP